MTCIDSEIGEIRHQISTLKGQSGSSIQLVQGLRSEKLTIVGIHLEDRLKIAKNLIKKAEELWQKGQP